MSAVVAVGVFDGLHRGHREILDRALAHARTRGAECVVLSFDPHPDLVLAKSFQAVLPLTPIPEKRERLTSMGVNRIEVLPFTREMAGLSPEVFVETHLIRPFDLTVLVVGEDFALGRARAGNVARLRDIGREAGFEVEAVPLLQDGGTAVSSTRIRDALEGGRVAEASRLLGRPYDLAGQVVTGEAVGRTLGYPTANLRLHHEKLVPADGVYAAWARIGEGGERLPAALSLGVRPTFGGHVRAIEAHLLDWSGELLGERLTIEFVDWLRGQERFSGREALIEAIERDVAQTRTRLVAAASRLARGAAEPAEDA